MARPVPADLEDALAANVAARDRFWSMPAEQKDSWVAYVERARMPGGRRRRVAETVSRLSGGTRVAAATEEASPAAVALPREDWMVWLLGLALLAALAAFLVWLTVFHNRHHAAGPAAVVVTQNATVPKVTGIRYQAAQFQLREAKLTSKLTRKAATKPKGIVVAQTPTHGKSVPQGTPVVLVVSNGPPGVAMPDVTGMAAADAVKALQARKLTATLKQVASSEAPGTVLSQTPAAGKRAKPGTEVVLMVARGATSVSIPNVVGQSQSAAVSALKQAGLSASLVRVPSTQPQGTVVAQNPAAGQKLARGSAVRLNVARSSAVSTTPSTTATTTATAATTTTKPPSSGNDYTGMRLADAVQKIAQGRQQAIVQYVTSNQPAGVVVSNSKAGNKERVQVSAGAHPKPLTDIPDVTSEDASTAQQDLRSAGFTVIQVTWPVSDESSDGTVVDETPTGQAPQGSAVVIYVGSASGG
jgi:beta-lactam-binding protein with PASTA domain